MQQSQSKIEKVLIKFEHYKKSTRKDVFVNFTSALPTVAKWNIIRNERDHIFKICSDMEITQKHLHEFNRLLISNDYPNE